MRTHEAGALHADINAPGPRGSASRRDANALVHCSGRPAPRAGADGALEVGGVDVRDLAAESARPRTSSTRPTSAPAPVPSGRPSPTTTSSTPARRSCARRSRAGSPRRGSVSTCAPAGELAVALRAGIDPARIGFHGNNKSTAELRARTRGRRRPHRVDSFHEIDRLARSPPSSDGRGLMVRVTAGVERTPTSTSPRHTRTRSSASPSTPGTPGGGAPRP